MYYNENTGLTEDQTLILSLDGDVDLNVAAAGTQMSGNNAAVSNGTGSTVDITATQLFFTAQPAPLLSQQGILLDLTTDPVVEAQDAAGNKDVDFAGVVTLSETGPGTATFANNAVTAVGGVATFSDMTLTYTATADQEAFSLQAASAPLTPATSSAFTNDIMLTTFFINNNLVGFDGQPKTIGVKPAPSDAPFAVTYDGSATVPIGPGVFAVQVFTTADPYQGTSTATFTINPPTAPVAGLVPAMAQGNPPLTVSFTDRSSGFIDTWNLQSGDDDRTVFTNRKQAAVTTYSKPGTYKLVLTVTGPGGQAQATASVIVNAPPTLGAVSSVGGVEDQVLTLDLTGVDAQAGTWSVQGADSPISQVAVTGDQIQFTPQPNAFGSDVVQVVRTNSFGLQTSTDLTVTWTAVDDPPAISASLPARFEADEDQLITVGGPDFAKDVDTDVNTLIWEASDFDDNLVASVQVGSVVFTPVKDASGETLATIRLRDPATGAQSAAHQVTLVWQPVDDPPQVPVPLFPPDGGANVSLTPALSWLEQIVEGQPAKYDLFFGVQGQPLELLAGGLEGAFPWDLGHLAASTTYQWKVVARSSTGLEREATFTFTTKADLVSPRLSAVQVEVMENRATLHWDTDEPASSIAFFKRAEIAQEDEQQGDDSGAAFVTTHALTLVALESGTKYSYRVRSVDPSGNIAESAAARFITLAAPDVLPPQILSGPAVQQVTSASAVVVLNTDELAVTTLRYALEGEDLAAGREVSTTALSEAQEIGLMDLLPGAAYTYEIVVRDGVGNQTSPRSGTFQTLAAADVTPPRFLSGPAVSQASDQDALVVFATDELARFTARYDVQENTEDGRAISANEANTEHQVLLSELAPQTTYYYQILLHDASDNAFRSDVLTFTTSAAPDQVPPQIVVGPGTEGLSDMTASIVFATDEPAQSALLLRRDVAGAVPTLEPFSALRSQHRFDLTNLAPDADFVFEIQLRDAAGNEAALVTDRFRTESTPDLAAPQLVSGPATEGIADVAAVVFWSTDEPADGRLRLGTEKNFSKARKQTRIGLELDHRFQFFDLAPATTYYYEVQSRDASGNISVPVPGSFTTLPTPDLSAPQVLTGPEAEGLGQSQASVVFTVDEPAFVQLRYSAIADLSEARAFQSTQAQTDYRIDLTGLEAATRYFYALKLQDVAGNAAAVAGDFTTAVAPDEQAPVFVQAPVVIDVSDMRGTLILEADEPVEVSALLSRSQDLSGTEVFNRLERRKSQSLDLTNLMADADYFFQVEVADAAGNRTTSAVGTFHTDLAPDIIPAEVMAGPSVQGLTAERATIFVRANEPVQAEVVLRDGAGIERTVSATVPAPEHEVALTNLEAGATYTFFVRLIDGASHVTTTGEHTFTPPLAADVTSPRFLGSASAVDVKSTVARIEWLTDEPADSRVLFGTTPEYGQQAVDVHDVTGHSVSLTHLKPNSTYHYQVQSTDAVGNGPSVSPDFNFATPALPDEEPPAFVGPVTAKDITDRTITLAFATDELSVARIDYGLTDAYERGPLQVTELRSGHEVRLTSLPTDATVFIRAHITDAVGNGPTSSHRLEVTTLPAPDVLPPHILTGPVVSKVTEAEAVVEWSTDEPADGRADYGLGGLTYQITDPEDRRDHTLILSGLEAGQTYALVISSTDAAGNGPTQSAPLDFTTAQIVDVLPPNILSGPAAEVIETEVTIRWSTDEPSNTVVDYGLTPAYGVRLERGELVADHQVHITGLTSGTTYHFRISSADLSGNQVSTDPQGNSLHSVSHTFTTRLKADITPPVMVVAPRLGRVTNRSAVITWVTDEPATSAVKWAQPGRSRSRGYIADNALVRKHLLTLTNLRPRVQYLFSVTSQDAAGNEVVWGADSNQGGRGRGGGINAKLVQQPDNEGFFVTQSQADILKPVLLSPPKVIERTHTSLTIQWETDEPADGVVRYGTTDELDLAVAAASDVLEHRLILSNLMPGQTYYYRVESTDPSDNGPTASVVLTDATAREFDLTAPAFARLPEMVDATQSLIELSWEMNEAADAIVTYADPEGERRTLWVDQRRQVHRVVLTDLRPDTRYQVGLSAADASQNRVELAEPLQVQTTASPDQTPPQLVGEPEVVSVTDRTAVVVFNTDEPTTGQVLFGRTRYLGEMVEPVDIDVAHRTVLTHLEPDRLYFFLVRAVDRTGNESAPSPFLTFRTERLADTEPPVQLLGVQAEAGGTEVRLIWPSSTAPDLSGYNVYRALEEEAFALLTTQVTEPTYLDAGLEEARIYRYQVTALDRENPPNESEPSQVAVAETGTGQAPSQPSALQVLPGISPTQPVLLLSRSTPVRQSDVLDYVLQISSDLSFGNVVARTSRVEATRRLVRWQVERVLQEGLTYWWRGRASDGRFRSPWSAPLSFTLEQLRAVAGGDFNIDGTVDFFDFFLFLEQFGGEDSGFDLTGDGLVDAEDFRLFLGQFGDRVEGVGKRAVRPDLSLAPEGALGLEARGEYSYIDVQVSLHEVAHVAGFGTALHFDPDRLRFVGLADSLHTVLGAAREQVFLVKEERPGRLALGAHRLQGTTSTPAESGLLARLRFTFAGAPQKTDISLQGGVLTRRDLQLLEVVDYRTVQVLPQVYALYANYPNPFNASTTIPLAIPARAAQTAESVGVVIYNVLGQAVRDLTPQGLPPGYHRLVWDGRDEQGHSVGSGIYVVRLQAEGFVQTRKLVLLQ